MKNPNIFCRSIRRDGFALVETVGLISIIAMLLSLSAMLLNQSYRIHQRALVNFQQLEQLGFWAERFRSDAHASTVAELSEGITFLRGADAVQYSIQNSLVVRRVRVGERKISEEVWHAPRVSAATWDIELEGRIPLVSCHFEFQQQPSRLDPVVWYARVGLLANSKSEGSEYVQ